VICAHIHEDFIGSVDVSIVMHPAEGSMDPRLRILRLPTADRPFADWEEIQPLEPLSAPTMRLGAEEARAVLAGLTAHFHGAEDTRALRRDYDGERKRVDDLIGHLAVIAKQVTAPPPSPLTPIAMHGVS
jgi:hypothetical protein